MADTIEFQVTVRLDATLSIKTGDGQYNYVKPGVEASTKFKYLPTNEEVDAALAYMHEQVITPTMDDVIQASAERIREING